MVWDIKVAMEAFQSSQQSPPKYPRKKEGITPMDE
jgi:hypothetical protein